MDKEKLIAFYNKYLLDKDEYSDEESVEIFLQFFFLLYEEYKKSKDVNAFDFADGLSIEEIRKDFIKGLGLVYDLESIRCYQNAVDEFKKLFCNGKRPTKKNTKSRPGFFSKAMAVYLGIVEGLGK